MRTDKKMGRDVIEEYLTKADDLPIGLLSIAPSAAPDGIAVPASRNTALYTAHSYHTKVPPEAIAPFIEHFTMPGDLVLDLFCGSGMTGVAAAMTGRQAILNDLSPAAVHLAWNHTQPCNPIELGDTFKSIERKVSADIRKLYSTTDANGDEGIIFWTMWSAIHICPECKSEFSLWSAVDKDNGRMGSEIECPHCKKFLKRRGLTVIDSVPTWISYKTKNGVRREREANDSDIAKAKAFKRSDIPEWYPSVPLGPDREMYIRCALHLKGINEIADFYTPRNLHALAIIWAAIEKISDPRMRAVMRFAFTNTAWHGTKMRRFNARGGQRPLTGTLYIPQLSSEVNVLEVMRNKISQLKRYYSSYRPLLKTPPSIINSSATELKDVRDESIDYVFTDPPFGSNLFYADCNLIWESWLGKLTDSTNEAVINSSLSEKNGGKTLADYGELMALSLRQIARVLKPGGWATIVFHNTDGDVWAALHTAAVNAGFEFHEASSLDRKQQSHKGYKGRSGEEDVAHFDVVMNLRKPLENSVSTTKHISYSQAGSDLRTMVNAAMSDPNTLARGAQGVHAEIVRRLVSKGEAVFFDFADVRRILEES
ncbi:DNA methyltransferase [Massilia timonae]|uniref:DNA methyltransferase n=1 Tax=Massilia timonae TaxID=47229 RepID=UPI002357B45A|nr:DNA methyltransferase [Massilia timonae]